MEASEVNYEQKAESLTEYFKDSFLHFLVTAHPADIPGEARGKGSNVAYAARHGCAEMMQRGIDRRRLILTVSDSDSSIPELYIKEVNNKYNNNINLNANDKHLFVYVCKRWRSHLTNQKILISCCLPHLFSSLVTALKYLLQSE
jgi:hypothetical protein